MNSHAVSVTDKFGLRRPGVLCSLTGILLATLFVMHCLVINFISDDAFISFRYVKNFLNGHGLVFNPGERVEGYTNFLWVVILAISQYLLPAISLLRISQVLGVLIGAATVCMIVAFSSKQQPLRSFAWVGAALLSAHTGFVAWATGGLEGSLFAFLAFAGAWAHVHYVVRRDRWWLAPLLFALTTMTRPDGCLFFAVTGIHFFFFERGRTGRWFNPRLFLWLAVFLAVYAPYFGWRYSYYGYLLPNTFYAKTTGIHLAVYERGVRYLWEYFRDYGLFLPFLYVFLLIRQRSWIWEGYFSCQTVVYLGYIVSVGGDGLAFSRFVSYIAPFLCLLLQRAIQEVHDLLGSLFPKRTWLVASTCAVVIVGTIASSLRPGIGVLLFPERARSYERRSRLSFPGYGTGHSYKWFTNYFVDRQAVAARWLEANAPPNSLVAASPAGSISYYMSHRLIDMLGLNDIHIAHSEATIREPGRGRAGHEKGDGQYVLSRSPDFILLGNVAVLAFPVDAQHMPEELLLKSEHEIWNEPGFHRDYDLVTVRLAPDGLFQYFTFYRKKTLASSGVTRASR